MLLHSVSECGSLEPPLNGNIETTGTKFWAEATYSCNSGFVLVGDAVRTCEASGFWSGTAPFCTGRLSQALLHLLLTSLVIAPFTSSLSPSLSFLAVECAFLEPPKDGQVHFTSTRFGAIATYECLPGFHLMGNEERTCLENGQWSGTPPTCESK